MMNMSMQTFKNDQSFFPTSAGTNFDSYNMDVLYSGGMNPWTHADQNTYNISLTEGISKKACFLIVYLIFFVF